MHTENATTLPITGAQFKQNPVSKVKRRSALSPIIAYGIVDDPLGTWLALCTSQTQPNFLTDRLRP